MHASACGDIPYPGSHRKDCACLRLGPVPVSCTLPRVKEPFRALSSSSFPSCGSCGFPFGSKNCSARVLYPLFVICIRFSVIHIRSRNCLRGQRPANSYQKRLILNGVRDFLPQRPTSLNTAPHSTGTAWATRASSHASPWPSAPTVGQAAKNSRCIHCPAANRTTISYHLESVNRCVR